MSLVSSSEARQELARFYRRTLVEDVLPFWIRHGIDNQHGGILTCVDRAGSLLDSDKSIWFQGRAGWMFATTWMHVEPRAEWLAAAESCVSFLDRHGSDASGKLYFTVTREGLPLRMRRYAYSEAFAAIANAALARATGREVNREQAVKLLGKYLHYSFTPEATMPKVNPETRPMIGLGPLMIGLATAQELQANLGDLEVSGNNLSGWAAEFIHTIERLFYKEDLEVLMETVSPDGSILDHFDGRTLNPGHALECAWFILHEGRCQNQPAWIELGLNILKAMWRRGWDETHGGLFYFRDLHGKPVQEYWHDMKFWWPHCEAIIATLLAWDITKDPLYAQWHQQVHEWSFGHFADPEHGEWFGYLHRDGSPSVKLKGNLWKGPFHLPRMLWYASQLLAKPWLGADQLDGTA